MLQTAYGNHQWQRYRTHKTGLIPHPGVALEKSIFGQISSEMPPSVCPDKSIMVSRRY